MRSTTASLLALAQATTTWAATVEYDWELTWVNAAPDGFMRPVIGINNKWPCPPIVANVGDQVVVRMKNSLGNQTSGFHFHGINQVDTNFYDGASMVNQCPVPPGSSISYNFKVDEPGSYWYHSHNMGQYPDGLRGSLIVNDPGDPQKSLYDEEVVMSLSDWYHEQSVPLVQAMLQKSNTQFRPPMPDSLIVNEGAGANINVVAGKTYRVRIINYSALGSAMIDFGGRAVSIINIDASRVQPADAKQIRIAPAERYDVLIKATAADVGKNIPFTVALDVNRDYSNTATPSTWAKNVTGYLVTDSKLPMVAKNVVAKFEPFDDSKLLPLDNVATLGPVTKSWQLDFEFCKDANGFPRACFNGQTYVTQKVPTLYSAATMGNLNNQSSPYGAILPFFVSKGDVVEIIVNNKDGAIHPFHLHGHQFQVVSRPMSNAGVHSALAVLSTKPPRRDVVTIHANSYAVLRFVANNPGIQLFHCHIEWHVEMGLTATLIEAPEALHNYPIPEDHLAVCRSQGIPTAGNAAGNTKDAWDVTGFNVVPATVYTGADYPAPAQNRRRGVLKTGNPTVVTTKNDTRGLW